MKLELPPSEGLYPVPVVLVSCIDKVSTRPNIITIAWCGVVCSKPPMVSISVRPSRHSYKLIKDTGDFVINIPTKDIMKKVDLCGVRSGRDADKFKLCSFTQSSASKVISPLIEECPFNIECRLKETIELGAHAMFIGEVVAIHANKMILNEKNTIDFTKASPFVYNHGEYWDLGKKIGSYGCSSK